jgi:hypothetical protein
MDEASVDRKRTSESRLLLSERLPLAAGTSPFHVKGHIYGKMLDDFEESVAGGVSGVLARVGDSEITTFVRQRFTASGWYDALPMMPLSLAHARLLGIPFHQHLRDRGRRTAEQDIPGIYRFLIKLSSPEEVCHRLPKAASHYFDFGPADARLVAPRRVVSEQRGVPVTLVPLIAATTEGFVQAALEMAGAERVSVRCKSTVNDGEKSGVATMTITLEGAWEVRD